MSKTTHAWFRGAVGALDRVPLFGTTLTKNTADFNAQDGIYVQDLAVIDGGGNSAKGNDYLAGIPPEQCYALVCA